MTRPRIAITLDAQDPGGYSKQPWYAVRQNYCDAVHAAGGIPVALPHHPELAETYLEFIDGILITGGDFDIPPHLYGEETVHKTVHTKGNRTAFEFNLCKAALAQGKPVLGICGGQQLLNVVLGGTLHQHVPDAFPDSPLKHEQPNPRTEAGHTVSVKNGTLLQRIVGTESFGVNSAHHQAVKSVGAGVVINATAPDGVIEGIEHPGHGFCLGVQWHPEYHVGQADKQIFEEFLKACTRRG
ncbi:MAG: gamma-glutamyl-gamma-aminobutyrate hydrolase family protein [Alphaproteobacteria bacterium]|jgi:putative glutamine amidotransferase|nr:gamma-glutamyl-gamma-aminobutyrate hydrolase family protein [Thalassospira sp.]MCE2964877.1 gamma-glutamyl-gamma-aminobutyrate hydrolase family protein [Alphaproteobacteria bacterium]